MCHDSGEETRPVQTVVSLPITGAQTSGSAQSYALKQYLRGLFLVKTGERDDPDFHKQVELEVPSQGDQLAYDMASLEAKIQSFKTRVSLNAWISENNALWTSMNKSNPSDYNRLYGIWTKQEKDLENGTSHRA